MSDRAPATPVTIADVEAARVRLDPVVVRTPVLPLEAASGVVAHVKCENLQRTGSFKLRGLYNRVATLAPDARTRGIVTLSAGNAGAAAALAARLHGVPCVVVMPADGVPRKARLIARLGGEVVRVERREELEAAVDRLAAARGLTFVHSYDEDAIIAGQGTVALELLDQVRDLDALIVPTGGGGLLAGSAVVVRERAPGVRLIAAEALGAATLAPSLAARRPVTISGVATIADGLATSTYGTRTLAHVLDVVDDVVGVSEADILARIAFAWEHLRLAIEPAAAVALAALEARTRELAGVRVAVVLSGGNVEPALLARALRETPWR